MRFAKLDGPFGEVLEDFPDSPLADEELGELLEHLYANRFLVLKTKGLTKRTFVDFATRIGDPITLSSDPDFPEIAHISNKEANTLSTRQGAAHWHTDQSFRRTVSSVTMLYSVEAPELGGETKFCNMAAAYDALADWQKDTIKDLVVEHRHGVSVSAPPGDHTPIPPKGWDKSHTVFHPLIRRHPETRQPTLYAVTGTAQGVCGMEQAEANKLLNELRAHVLQPQFTTAYRHEVQDLVMWDNPTVMHSATPINQATGLTDQRLIWRISLRGSPPLFQHVDQAQETH